MQRLLVQVAISVAGTRRRNRSDLGPWRLVGIPGAAFWGEASASRIGWLGSGGGSGGRHARDVEEGGEKPGASASAPRCEDCAEKGCAATAGQCCRRGLTSKAVLSRRAEVMRPAAQTMVDSSPSLSTRSPSPASTATLLMDALACLAATASATPEAVAKCCGDTSPIRSLPPPPPLLATSEFGPLPSVSSRCALALVCPIPLQGIPLDFGPPEDGLGEACLLPAQVVSQALARRFHGVLEHWSKALDCMDGTSAGDEEQMHGNRTAFVDLEATTVDYGRPAAGSRGGCSGWLAAAASRRTKSPGRASFDASPAAALTQDSSIGGHSMGVGSGSPRSVATSSAEAELCGSLGVPMGGDADEGACAVAESSVDPLLCEMPPHDERGEEERCEQPPEACVLQEDLCLFGDEQQDEGEPSDAFVFTDESCFEGPDELVRAPWEIPKASPRDSQDEWTLCEVSSVGSSWSGCRDFEDHDCDIGHDSDVDSGLGATVRSSVFVERSPLPPPPSGSSQML